MTKYLILSIIINMVLVYTVCNQTAKYSGCMVDLLQKTEGNYKWK